jgi:hypothetical protein
MKCDTCELYYETTENHINEKFISGTDLGVTSSMDGRMGPKMCQHDMCFSAIRRQEYKLGDSPLSGVLEIGILGRVMGQAQLLKNNECEYYQERIGLWKRLCSMVVGSR